MRAYLASRSGVVMAAGCGLERPAHRTPPQRTAPRASRHAVPAGGGIRHLLLGLSSEPPLARPRRLPRKPDGECMNTYWHPFADMSVVKTGEVVMEGGEGAWVCPSTGATYREADGLLTEDA